jgi:hypothetical protein
LLCSWAESERAAGAAVRVLREGGAAAVSTIEPL